MEACSEDIHQSDAHKTLTPEETLLLTSQNSRLVSSHKANLLEIQAKKHWDLFYKRNETRFFRDRHWTTREFAELLGVDNAITNKRVLFEIGCGVGNFIFPLVEEKLDLHIFACDISPRAVELVKGHPMYDSLKMNVFAGDITSDVVINDIIGTETVDITTSIFVLSAIHPDKHVKTLENIYRVLKPGGLLLFRDYGLYDMAQLRFKPGNKIADNFYMRQDGTRSYFFCTQYVEDVFKKVGFNLMVNSYVHRRTINKKDNIDVPRIFIQVKAEKPHIK